MLDIIDQAHHAQKILKVCRQSPAQRLTYEVANTASAAHLVLSSALMMQLTRAALLRPATRPRPSARPTTLARLVVSAAAPEGGVLVTQLLEPAVVRGSMYQPQRPAALACTMPSHYSPFDCLHRCICAVVRLCEGCGRSTLHNNSALRAKKLLQLPVTGQPCVQMSLRIALRA